MTSASTPPTILVVDDARFEQRMLVDLLTDHGYEVDVASTGTQGYELALATRPDLILMDVRMPDLDGIACCRLLKANAATQAIPVIFLSSADTPAERVTGLSAGGVDYVGKPFTGEELVARIRIHLALGRPRAAAEVAPAEPGRTDPDLVLVTAAQRVIADNLAQLPGLTEIARRVGTYRERLNGLFRQQLGVSVFEYVRELRISRAVALLKETAMEVRDIAELVGFSSPGNFSTAFRDRMGTTPSAYRDTLRRGAGPDADQPGT
ncbi:DNA-binding response OmpR family regulator [Pseudoduganella lurida]|uniref:DNA-binding response OmpR family regulator n=1 Tax=Pseudoduganella lurida TaxID=1036180 RepID=A0A562REF5_9BURK|nr:DNA-binding response regulator [Pseudoduganella lurida]TWI67303.1 DNA-binding response OmpR family regulator [Pseudoduganella lurida]